MNAGWRRWGGLALAFGLLASPAEARTVLSGTAFGTGLVEPIIVLEHLAGLLALGLWAGQHGDSAAWQIPCVAVFAILAAGLIANLGVPLPKSGYFMTLTTIAAGCLVGFEVRLPPVATVPAAALLAFFHGYMTGGPIAFWVAYALGSLLVLTSGLGLVTVLGRGVSARAIRVCGGGAALAGIIDLAGRL